MTYFFSQLPLIFIKYGLPLLWLLWSPKIWNFIYLASKAALNIEMFLVLRAKRTKKLQRCGAGNQSGFDPNEQKVFHMCFERFLLAFESRDLSHADKRIIRVSSFPSFNFWMINYSCTQKSYLALWQNCFGFQA